MRQLLLLFFFYTPLSVFAQVPKASAPEVYRDFIIAVIKGDKTSAEKLALPNPEIDILFSSDKAPPETVKEAVAYMAAHPYRVLTAGEIFTLPNGHTISSTEESERKGWVIIANDTDPLPHMLKSVSGVWMVDAGELIAARKAAAKTQK